VKRTGPFCRASQNQDGYLPAGEILLVLNPLIGRQEQIETRILGRFQEIAVAQSIPASCFR
jgi:hypothetical protein